MEPTMNKQWKVIAERIRKARHDIAVVRLYAAGTPLGAAELECVDQVDRLLTGLGVTSQTI